MSSAMPIVFEVLTSEPFRLSETGKSHIFDEFDQVISGLQGWYMQIIDVVVSAPEMEGHSKRSGPWCKLRPYAPHIWTNMLNKPAFTTTSFDVKYRRPFIDFLNPRVIAGIEIIEHWGELQHPTRYRVVEAEEASELLAGHVYRDTLLSSTTLFRERVESAAQRYAQADRARVSEVLRVVDHALEARLAGITSGAAGDPEAFSLALAGNLNTLSENLRRYFFAATKEMKQEILEELRQSSVPGGDDVH